jgi:hypothetical protein
VTISGDAGLLYPPERAANNVFSLSKQLQCEMHTFQVAYNGFQYPVEGIANLGLSRFCLCRDRHKTYIVPLKFAGMLGINLCRQVAAASHYGDW